MAELIKLVLDKLGGYFALFINLLVSPRLSPNSIKLYDKRKLNNGLIFFGISAVISFVVKIPFTPTGVDAWIYIAQDALWKIILVVSAAVAARVAWFGKKSEFGDYVVGNCFIIGVLSILIPLFFIVVENLPRHISEYVGVGISLVALLGIVAWSVGAWLSFGVLNSAPLLSSVLRLPLFIGLLLAIGQISLFIRLGTIQRTIAAAGGNDYTGHNSSDILLSVTFGLYP